MGHRSQEPSCACDVLLLVVQVGELLEQRRLYQAWQLIQEIRSEHLGGWVVSRWGGGQGGR